MSVNHKHLYKPLRLDTEEMRKRREEEGVQLRKQQREEWISKKRNVANEDDPGAEPSVPTLSYLLTPAVMQWLHSSNTIEQIAATHVFRKVLSQSVNPPIDMVIEAGTVPIFVTFLMNDSNAFLQYEAGWVLTNIASGTSLQTRAVVDAGAVPVLIKLLSSQHENVREICAWALGNIAGDSPQLRDLLLDLGVADAITELLVPGKNKQLAAVKNAVWTIANLCQGIPPPDFNKVSRFLPTLSRLLFHHDDEVLTDAVIAILHLVKSNERIQAVIEAGCCRRLVELLQHPKVTVSKFALRAIANIVSGDDFHTQVVLNCSVLPCLLNLLRFSKGPVLKEVCFTISNIAAGNQQQIQALIDAGILPPVIELFKTGDFQTKTEITYIVANIASRGSSDQVRDLVDQGCIPPLCNFLAKMDLKTMELALGAIDNILKHGENTIGDNPNYYGLLIEECKGLDKIEFLQAHENTRIYKKAFDIIERYFAEEEEKEEDTI